MTKVILFSILSLLFFPEQQNNNDRVPEAGKTIQTLNYSQESTDSILKKELEFIAVEDQTLRLLLPDINKKFGSKSKETKYIWSLINRQDSLCLEKVLHILDKHGWLGKSRVGSKANQALWLVIQHAPVREQEKYLPLLKESVLEKESEAWHLAFLEDRILMRKGKKQRYGSQAVFDKKTGKFKIHLIQDLKNVNKRRKELGLKTIEEYAKMNGYIFDQIK